MTDIVYDVHGNEKTQRSATNSSAWKKIRKVVLKEETHCHICLGEVDKGLKFPEPYSGTVDHIVPSSQGGTDDRSNLRLAHNLCNQRRSTKPIDEVRKTPHSRKWY